MAWRRLLTVQRYGGSSPEGKFRRERGDAGWRAPFGFARIVGGSVVETWTGNFGLQPGVYAGGSSAQVGLVPFGFDVLRHGLDRKGAQKKGALPSVLTAMHVGDPTYILNFLLCF